MAAGVSAARRTGQFFTGFAALVVLVALFGGAPIALLTVSGNPLPDHLPTLAEIGTALTTRDDGRLFLRALAVLGWAGWATFALSLLVELPARAFRRPAPRLPGMGRQQRAAAALVGAVALVLVTTPAANAAAAYGVPPPLVATQVAAPAIGATIPSGPAPRWLAGPVDGPAPRYRVARGDYLGQVAARYLGDFDRYPEVARLNKLRDADRIKPGQVLRLPAGATDHGRRPHAQGRLTVPAPTSRQADNAPRPAPRPAPVTDQPTPQDDQPAEAPISTGAAGADAVNTLNRPLAVSAVLSVAGIFGAQVGAVLGLRRRPGAAGDDLAVGRHRRFRS